MLSDQARAALKALQPCYRGNDPKPEVLGTLKGLSNCDKHRLLHPAVLGLPTGERFFTTFDYNDLEILYNWHESNMNALEEGAVLARIGFRKIGPDLNVRVQGHFPINVTFHNVSHGLGEPVIPLLRRIRDFVRDRVFPELEPYI